MSALSPAGLEIYRETARARQRQAAEHSQPAPGARLGGRTGGGSALEGREFAMSRTALELSPREWHAYDPASAIKHRSAEERLSLAARRREALKVARRIARLLRTEYGAQRVMLFGSLARRGGFTLWSDIDLAAWGIPAERFFAAVAATTGYSSLFRIDLVDADECRPSLLSVIKADGKEL